MYSASYETNGIKGSYTKKRYRYKSNTEEYTAANILNREFKKELRANGSTINGYH